MTEESERLSESSGTGFQALSIVLDSPRTPSSEHTQECKGDEGLAQGMQGGTRLRRCEEGATRFCGKSRQGRRFWRFPRSGHGEELASPPMVGYLWWTVFRVAEARHPHPCHDSRCWEACERTWRDVIGYDFVHSKERNLLSPKRANDLVYVFTNMRLQKIARLGKVFADWDIYSDEE